MVKGNNQVPNEHYKKKWYQVFGRTARLGVKTWFNQPARKERRRKGEGGQSDTGSSVKELKTTEPNLPHANR
jgi:hypothetical protein